MKIYKQIGSKDRIFELMQNVNKIRLNEDFIGSESSSDNTLNIKFEQLKNQELHTLRSNTQSNGDSSFVELVCTDDNGNQITFRFQAEASQGDQDGVYNVNNVIMTQFTYNDKTTGKSLDIDENGLNEFNAQHGSELFDVVSNYADFETETPEIDEGYMDAIKKIDSYPFGGTPRTMQTGSSYADEKPTNDKVRVKSNQLDKYVVNEVDISNLNNIDTSKIVQGHVDNLPQHMKQDLIRQAVEYTDKQLKSMGHSVADFPKEQYKEIIRRTANMFYEDYLTRMNEDVSDNGSSEEILKGGVGDNKNPVDFNPEEIKLGMKVEMEHTDDPNTALEIALDHLSEDPAYYTSKGSPECSAQANAAKDAEEMSGDELGGNVEIGMDSLMDTTTGTGMRIPHGDNNSLDDKEKTDMLLGYKPKNVGDNVDEEIVGSNGATPIGNNSTTPSQPQPQPDSGYKKYQTYHNRDFNSLDDDEKEEFFGLWKQHGRK